MGGAHAAFFEMQAVDQGQFVKSYLAAIKNTAKLTKAGMQVFEIVYNQMRENPQTDKIELNVYLAKKFGMEMSERTYQRGLRELLENEFLYRSPSADVFFVNIIYMFNGNRITLAKSYYLRETGIQGELPFEGQNEQPKLPKQAKPPNSGLAEIDLPARVRGLWKGRIQEFQNYLRPCFSSQASGARKSNSFNLRSAATAR